MSNLEAGRNVSLETVIRVAMVLGRSKELEALFHCRSSIAWKTFTGMKRAPKRQARQEDDEK
ncbi:hypothetical protein [Burkholderia ambifaria]